MSDKTYVSRFNKYFMFFLNVIIWLLALAVVIVCAYVLVEKKKEVRDALDFFLDPACFLTLLGSVAVGLTTAGCMGSLRENRCLLKTYHYIATIFLLFELAAGILLVVLFYVPDAQVTLKLYPEEALTEAIIKYRDDADLEDLMNTVQKDLKCCGVSNDDNGYLDWSKNMYFNCSDGNISPERCSVPASCCVRKKDEMANHMCGSDSQNKQITSLQDVIYTRGCLKAIRAWIEDNALMAGGIALGIIIPQIIFIYIARQLDDQVGMQLERLKRSRQRDQYTNPAR